MSLETELEAIRTGAAIAPLTDRAFLRITGTDATRWLNGMVTNSIQDLKPGEGNYNFLLNAQGRIQGDCMIYRIDDPATEFILESSSDQIDSIEALLNRFIIMDDVEIAQLLYTSFPLLAEAGIALVGADAGRVLLYLLGGEGEMSPKEAPESGHLLRGFANGPQVMVFAPSSVAGPTYEIWFESKSEADLASQQLMVKGAIELSPAAIEAHRILTGTPKYGIDIRNTDTAKDLPQETNQTHALHFNKGCYLGQEIVERIRSRGQVHRIFTQFTLTGAVPTTLPAPIEATLAGQTRPAGEITSAIQIGDTIHALGYLRREFATAPLTYSGGTATPKSKTL